MPCFAACQDYGVSAPTYRREAVGVERLVNHFPLSLHHYYGNSLIFLFTIFINLQVMVQENMNAITHSRRTIKAGGSILKTGIKYSGRLNVWRKTTKRIYPTIILILRSPGLLDIPRGFNCVDCLSISRNDLSANS